MDSEVEEEVNESSEHELSHHSRSNKVRKTYRTRSKITTKQSKDCVSSKSKVSEPVHNTSLMSPKSATTPANNAAHLALVVKVEQMEHRMKNIDDLE